MTFRKKLFGIVVVGAMGTLLVMSQLSAGSHVRPRGATPFYASMVPTFKACALPGNRTHGAPLSFASCNPPQQQSSYLTVGTPDANSAPAQGQAYVLLQVKTTSPEDVFIKSEGSDIRCRPGGPIAFCTSGNLVDGPDYTGTLRGNAMIRITDHYNGPGLNEAATVIDIPFPVDGTCAATPNTIGAQCSVNTSANAVVQGSVKDNQRGVVEISQLNIFDGGADGAASTPADNTLYSVQGLFIP